MIKYKITQEGMRESDKRSLSRKLYYSIEDKILQMLKSGVGYDADSIYTALKGDRTIRGEITIGSVTRGIAILEAEKYAGQITESPLQSNDNINDIEIGGRSPWR